MADSIRKFSSKKNPSKLELVEFRNYVAQLKKQGKITSKVSARNARPANVSGGKTFAEIVNSNRDDLKPYVSKFKLPKQTPFNVRDIPGLEGLTLAQSLKELEDNPQKYDRLIEPGDRVAVEIDGTGSRVFYSDVSALAEELRHYKPFTEQNGAKFNRVQIIRFPKGASREKYLKNRPVNKSKFAKLKSANANLRADRARDKKEYAKEIAKLKAQLRRNKK